MPRQIRTFAESKSPVVGVSKPRWLQVLGSGLITGASDDDPSGIATYSQAGAQFGFAITWTMLFTYRLMSAVQEISGASAERRALGSPAISKDIIRTGFSRASLLRSASPT
jgi:hypothetical protein